MPDPFLNLQFISKDSALAKKARRCYICPNFNHASTNCLVYFVRWNIEIFSKILTIKIYSTINRTFTTQKNAITAAFRYNLIIEDLINSKPNTNLKKKKSYA